jgi:mono/diheme cytochrome c family protein
MRCLGVVRARTERKDGVSRAYDVRRVLLGALRSGVSLAAVSILARLGVAQSGNAFPDTGYVTPRIIADGRTIFRGHGGCIACHGMDLRGGVGPTLLEHTWKDARNGTLAEIFRVVTGGVPGTTMLARPNGISDEQARRVTAYVWAASHHRAPP